jgi:hypothetical protein
MPPFTDTCLPFFEARWLVVASVAMGVSTIAAAQADPLRDLRTGGSISSIELVA